MHLMRHEVALISVIFVRACVCVCVLVWGWGALMVDVGTHVNGSKNNKHLGLLFLKPLIPISNLCHTKDL